jgi:hypothetical protein
MAELSAKLRGLEGGLIAFWCPGCDQAHAIGVAPPATVIWSFNGNLDRPTFAPSIRVIGARTPTEHERMRIMAGEDLSAALRQECHSFVTDGLIRFLDDCTHAFAGRIVGLPDWPRPAPEGP